MHICSAFSSGTLLIPSQIYKFTTGLAPIILLTRALQELKVEVFSAKR